jgi:hypothetical protein
MALTPEEQLELNDLLRDQEEINSRLIEQNRALATSSGSERRELESRIASERTRLALTEQRRGELERIVQQERQIAEEQERQVDAERERQNALDESHQYMEDLGQSMTKMTKEGREWLTKSNNGYTQMGSLIATLGQLKEQQAGLDSAALARNQEQIGIFEQLGEQMRISSERVGEQERIIKGINADQLERVEFEKSIAKLTEEQKIQARELYETNKKLLAYEQRLAAVREGQQDLIAALPESLQSGIGFIKNMITGIRMFGWEAAIATAGLTLVVAAIVAGLQAFVALEAAGEDFRKTTGLTNDQMGNLDAKVTNITRNFGNLGIEASAVYDTIAALKAETADFASYSEAAVGALTVMTANFGVSAENAAKVQNIMESVGGLSEDTAANVQMQVADMAKMAGVAPRKVLEDIAESAEEASTFFHGDIKALAKAAVEARRLGTSLKEVNKVAETLLDFEGGIEKELKAATFVQGQFNLSKARGLAADGKTVEANQEILKQLERSGKFKDKDYWTQKALADAAGMTVESINKQLNVQDKLSKLSAEERANAEKAIEQGLDLSNIKEEDLNKEVAKHAAQQEQASTLTELTNLLKGMVAEIGGALIPLFRALMPVIKIAFFPLKIAAKLIGYIIDGITWVISKIPGLQSLLNAMSDAADADWFGPKATVEGSSSTIPTPDEAQSAVLGMDVNDVTKTGDLKIKAGGKPMISTKEGGLFQLSPNDDIAAAPGLLSGGGMKSSLQSVQGDINVVFPKEGLNNIISGIKSSLNGGTNTSNTTETNLQTVQTNTPTNSVQTQTNELASATQSNITTNTNTTTPNSLAGLSAPLNAMIEELKALRADMASGKIGVYMDGSKVTSGIAKQVDKSTRNYYSMA